MKKLMDHPEYLLLTTSARFTGVDHLLLPSGLRCLAVRKR